MIKRIRTDKICLQNYYRLAKCLKRCNACAAIALHQAEIAKCYLGDRTTSLSFQLETASISFPFMSSIVKISEELSENILAINCFDDSNEVLNASASEELNSLCAQLIQKVNLFNSITEKIFQKLKEKQMSNAVQSIPLVDVIDTIKILAPALATLQRHHPQTLEPTYSGNDELTFITSHQTFELWFPTMLKYIDDVIEKLSSDFPCFLDAEIAVRKIKAIYQLFCEMIQIPQTMTAMDYLAFRSQLEGGSGVESTGFRLIEISLGQRDETLLSNLKDMNLMTDELADRLARPSVNDIYLSLLKKAGIITDVKNLDQAAACVAKILQPTGVGTEHIGLMGLGESLVELEQVIEMWRRHHLSMVDRMIGYRQSLGVGGRTPNELATPVCPYTGVMDGRPYLLQTLTYKRMFPYLWDARSLILEKKY